jgi:hypothetical protein
VKRQKIIGQALLHALATAVYVYLIVNLMDFMGHSNVENVPIFVPIGFLLLFVVSAAITASLVFGRPVMLYLDGKKKDALAFAMYTIAWLIVVAILVFSIALTSI